jgi:hypothetical protein
MERPFPRAGEPGVSAEGFGLRAGDEKAYLYHLNETRSPNVDLCQRLDEDAGTTEGSGTYMAGSVGEYQCPEVASRDPAENCG